MIPCKWNNNMLMALKTQVPGSALRHCKSVSILTAKGLWRQVFGSLKFVGNESSGSGADEEQMIDFF